MVLLLHMVSVEITHRLHSAGSLAGAGTSTVTSYTGA